MVQHVVGAHMQHTPVSNPLTRKTRELGQPFVVIVREVDPDSNTLSVECDLDRQVYSEVELFPVSQSGSETHGGGMPQKGWTGVGMFYATQDSGTRVCVLCWTGSGIPQGLSATPMRPSEHIEGSTTRLRGVHRKTYPGQRGMSLSAGYHEHEDAGWFRGAADLSQDSLDPDKREWVRTTGRSVEATEAGISYAGPVVRAGADPGVVPPTTLPDGTTRQVVCLQPGVAPYSRFANREYDAIPVTEVLSRVTEFGLDYPIPAEVLQSDLMDEILGSRQPLWQSTIVSDKDGLRVDDQSPVVGLKDQPADHPHNPSHPAAGPATEDGATPRRKGYILEMVKGTLVGYNPWDKATYGQPLKPTLWPRTQRGRFGSDTATGHEPVDGSVSESRLAATAFMLRFPYEYNTTRVEVTKEGQVLVEIGATLPKEKIGFPGNTYEHPHGAGRSLEAHLVGSAKLVVGKNRDEEDSLDLTTLGQVVLRLGADDGALPYAGRSVTAQNRGMADAITPRTLPYWDAAKLRPGDAGDLENKTGAENVSLRAATDGGVFLRLGARHANAKRRHLKNGYADGQGRVQDAPGGGGRSTTAGRPHYGSGDTPYRFNDLSTAGKPRLGIAPYRWSGVPFQPSDLDYHGQSADIHACRDIFLRVGKNNLAGHSILLDLEGGIVGIVGKDSKGRSLTSTLQGGVEITIGSNNQGQAMGLEVIGDVNWTIKGNWQVDVTGDIVFNSMKNIIQQAPAGEVLMQAVNIRQAAAHQHVSEAPDIIHNQGGHPATI